jgi:catechol 2,3-dioxygenase-like lactoylglutathione lyase family enzyme
MNILGLDNLVFGVDDMPGSRQYLLDYGLDEVSFDPATGGRFAALDGTCITIRHAHDASLPPLPPGAHSPCLRETLYGVDSDATLAALQAELAKDRSATLGADGVLRSMDDGGFAIGFQRSVRRPYTARFLGFNVAGQPPGRAPNDCAANPDEVIKPRTLSHLVYFVPDVAKAEAFYVERLGFRCIDRFTGVGPFLQPGGSLEHHSHFLIGAPEFMKGVEHFTFHFSGPNEVMQNGSRFIQKGYQPFWGPGRHQLGSNWFWYFNSPFACHMEMDADMDLHDNAWTARELPLGADASQAFLLGHREKWMPGPGTSENGDYA